MTDAIQVRRYVCRGRVHWNVIKDGKFFCRCFTEAAVRTTLARLRGAP
jgi:hypothetical protein